MSKLCRFMGRRLIVSLSAGCLVLLFSTMMIPRVALSAELAVDAERLVQDMADTVMKKLTASDISRDERKNLMKKLLNKYFHVPGIAQWVLGRFWRQASAEEREDYLSLFERLLIESYVDKFARYDNMTLQIIKTDVRNKRDAVVSSSLERPEMTSPLQLEWRVRVDHGVYKIIDIMVEGISMGQTQRSEFASAIRHNDGDISKFLDELRIRVSSASSGS